MLFETEGILWVANWDTSETAIWGFLICAFRWNTLYGSLKNAFKQSKNIIFLTGFPFREP